MGNLTTKEGIKLDNSKFKKGMATTLAAALICGVLPAQVHASDISGHWAEETMKQWVADGLLKGDGENYHPNDAVTRAQFMAFTNRALKLTEKAPVDQFKDVKPGDWFYDDVAKAVKAAYTNGTSADTMSPWANITNQQMYAILGRLATEDGTADLSVIKDLDSVDDWALEDLEDAIAGGYVVGNHGKVNPDKLATRAQAITILDRLMHDSRHFALPGVYTVDAQEVTVMDDGIILRDCTIAGDLILKKGVKSVRLDNVTVGGQIIREDEGTQVIQASGQWMDGTYEGVAESCSGPVRVKVTVKDGKISNLQLLEHAEGLVGEMKMDKVLDQILASGTLDHIDLNNDETITSESVLNAVKDALSQAGGRTLKPGQSKEAQLYTVMQDGTYTGEANGYGGRLRVQLVVKNGKIAELKLKSHQETPSYMVISQKILTRIADNDGTDGIDTISGATTTSRALIRAAEDAMSQALGKTKAPGETPESSLSSGHSGGLGNADKPEGQDFADKLKDGVYKGQAYGYGGLIKVTVTVKDKKISEVVVTDHNETGSYYDKAQGMPDRIVEANSTNVDTITGATATSRGILAAVEDALKEFMVQVEHADGVWYGQGRGYYPNDLYKYGQLVRTASEMAVTVTDGKVSKVEVVYHGDDEHYHKYLMEKFDVFEQYIIDHNGTDGIIDIMNKGDMSDPVYDSVSGATLSAHGYVAAIDDALRRSDKYSLDGQEQTIRSLTLLNHPGYTVPPTQFHYGDEVDFSGLKVLIKYRDGREETVPFADLKSRGIECTLDVKFTPQPANGDYSEATNYDLVFTDPVSTAQHRSELQASRKSIYREIARIEVTTGEDEVLVVEPNSKDFAYNVHVTKSDINGIKAVKVIDTNGKEVELKGYSITSESGHPVMRVNLAPLPAPEKTDHYKLSYHHDSYKLKLDVNTPFNPENIHEIQISIHPKTKYQQGQALDLTLLQIEAIDTNYKSEYIDFADMANHGFTFSREDDGSVMENGTILNEVGTFNILINHPGCESAKFSIEVTAGTNPDPSEPDPDKPSEGDPTCLLGSFEIRTVKDGKVIATVKDPANTQKYGELHVTVPQEYYEDRQTLLTVVPLDTAGYDMEFVDPEWYSGVFMGTFGDISYMILFESDEPAPTDPTQTPTVADSTSLEATEASEDAIPTEDLYPAQTLEEPVVE